mmetsp:Transcript_6777/g.27693  ORF Transcript_6777/g.27693 Transcript_6777/m.27693 type:complete len:209 (+) Transcript_6777:1578-2204(+)
MSMPRAATSVVSRIDVRFALKRATWILRAVWSIAPYTTLGSTPWKRSSSARYSHVCLVGRKTSVCWSEGTTLCSMCSSAAGLSASRTSTNSRCRSGLSLLSLSRRMSAGSRRPADANSARSLGMVALKSSVWRAGERPPMMTLICSRKPISKQRSASSSTQYSTERKLKPSISLRWCSKRPGVATMTSGDASMAANCASSASPPTTSV